MKLFTSLFVLGALAMCAVGEEERSFLIVRKTLKTDYATQGKNATISIDIYNAGDK
jgi:hypothetical protein